MDADRFDTLLAALSTAPSRRAALRVLGGLGLAGLVGPTAAKNKKKKKPKKRCAKAGQATGTKRKRCWPGLNKDGADVCAQPQTGGVPPRPVPPPPAAACRMGVAER